MVQKELFFNVGSCVDWVSGEGGELMTDDDNSTCAPVNQGTPDGTVLLYTYGILNMCINDGIFKVQVAMDSLAPCWYLRSVFFTERMTQTCSNKRSEIFRPCTILESQTARNRSVCTLSCKCATSSDQCFLQVYSGIKPDIPEFNVCDFDRPRS